MASDLDADKIASSITGDLGRALRYVDEIASTNTAAMEWATRGGPHGAVVVTDHQTGGRGRWGRSWFSLPGKLLQFSVILRPDLPVERHGLLTAALGVAVADALEPIVDGTTAIKWPNDVLVNDKKVTGILVETQTTGSTIAVAVCGIGINVALERDDLPPEIAPRASSLLLETNRPLPDRSALLADVLVQIEARYAMALDPGHSHAIISRAAQRSAILGRDVVVRDPDGSTIAGRALSFNDNGALIVESDGATHMVVVGEVEQLRTA